jgi:DMSO reductase family type II enzyme heme b subunit
MGPYRDLLSDQERWDLAHYITSLDREPTETNEGFVVVAALIDGKIPEAPDSPKWGEAASVVVPLAGQVVLEAGVGGSAPGSNRGSLGWWIPTAGSVTVRSLWNGSDIGFVLEWDDPTGPGDADSGLAAGASGPRSLPDSVSLQFAANEGSKPYFLFGDPDNTVKVWHWQSDSTSAGGGYAEEWTASGAERIDVGRASFRVGSVWKEGRWHVIFRRSLDGEPELEIGNFIPILFSVRDGANGEIDDVRAISTWLYVTLERPKSLRPWLMAFVYLLGAVIVELWILSRIE